MSVLLGFHTASTLSGSLRSPPSPSGEGCGMGENRTLIFYLFPPSSGRRCPEGAEVGYRSEMKSNERQSVLSYRHPERSRGIFYALAVLCIYEVMIKMPRRCSSSDALRLNVVQEGFLAALEMTIWGRRPSEGAAFLHDRSLGLSYRQYPIRLASLATFPKRGRLWYGGKPYSHFLPFPSFLWKEVPRRGGGWLPERDEKQ